MTIADMLKSLANNLGALLPRSLLSRFGSLLNYLSTGCWMKEHGFYPMARVRTRSKVIETLAQHIRDKEVLYLEFGVWRGETINIWSKLLRSPASRLHGFASFEGLPESWNDCSATGRPLEKGHFSTAGSPPVIADPRVKFFKGWFEDTLSMYDFVPSPVLIIFLDADLYSSTCHVLKFLLPHIKIGTILYFDEFWDPQHEQRAFSEFLASTSMTFKALAADFGTKHVAFERVA